MPKRSSRSRSPGRRGGQREERAELRRQFEDKGKTEQEDVTKMQMEVADSRSRLMETTARAEQLEREGAASLAQLTTEREERYALMKQMEEVLGQQQQQKEAANAKDKDSDDSTDQPQT